MSLALRLRKQTQKAGNWPEWCVQDFCPAQSSQQEEGPPLPLWARPFPTCLTAAHIIHLQSSHLGAEAEGTLCRKIETKPNQENEEAFGFQGLHPLAVRMLTGKFNPLLLNPSRNYVAKTILAGGEALGLEKCLEFLENPGRAAVEARVWSAPAAGPASSLGSMYYSLFLEGSSSWGSSPSPAPNWTISALTALSPTHLPPPPPGCRM